jgi:hypothetical protein
MLASLVTTAALVAGSLSAAASPQQHPLPPARTGITFTPDTTEVSLDRLLAELARSTGLEVALSRQQVRHFRDVQIALDSAAAVPPEQVYPFVEGHLAAHGVWIAPLKGGARPVLGVGDGRPGVLSLGLPVSLSGVNALAQHPALLVCLMMPLEHVDPRTVPKRLHETLRALNEPGIDVCPCGTRNLILRGCSSQVLQVVKQVAEMDAAAGREEPDPASVHGDP